MVFRNLAFLRTSWVHLDEGHIPVKVLGTPGVLCVSVKGTSGAYISYVCSPLHVFYVQFSLGGFGIASVHGLTKDTLVVTQWH